MIWTIELTATAAAMLADIADRRVRQKIKERIDQLAREPEKQGKALTDDFTGYRSLRAAGQRYRIIYKIQDEKVIVVVVAVGIRREGSKRDIYALAKKLIRLRLLEPPRK